MKYCIDCGKGISKYSKRCRKCSALSKERAKRISLGKINEKNPMWKGDNVGYIPLHNWVRRRKPKPKLCEECEKNKPYDLANISGEYKRDINDFEWICRSCHMKKDGRMDNLHEGKRRKHKSNLIECSKCKEFKTKEEFYKNKKKWDGLDSWCKECVKKNLNKETKKRYDKTYYKKPEVKERRRKWAKENYAKRILKDGTKKRAI